MFRLLWALSVRIHAVLAHLPGNRVLAFLRSRRGLKWGVPGMLLAVPYMLTAWGCTLLIEQGWPGWLHLIVLVTCWSAIKFLVMGPLSVILLVRARIREAIQVRRARRAAHTTGAWQGEVVSA